MPPVSATPRETGSETPAASAVTLAEVVEGCPAGSGSRWPAGRPPVERGADGVAGMGVGTGAGNFAGHVGRRQDAMVATGYSASQKPHQRITPHPSVSGA